MKKTAYIILLITLITLTACGNAGSSKAPEAETALSEIAETPDIMDESGQPTETADDGQAQAADLDKASTEPVNATPQDADAGNKAADASETPDSKTADSETIEASDNDNENEPALPEYTVTAFEDSRTMYASNAVNVRKGPSTDFDIVGSLKSGQEATVTGQADTMWYEIQYGEDKAFVSNKYLQDEKPAEEPAPETNPEASPQQAAEPETPPQEAAVPQPVTEVKNVAGVILVGDSRFVQMKESVGDNPCTWVAEGGKGYNWFNEKAIARIDSCVGKGSKILINLGVNDTGNLQKYISLVNAKADEWVGKGATVYYASVNPVWENPYVTEEQVEYFNSQMQSSLSANVHWIDSHSYLTSIGYKLVDGLHYSTETYQNIYAYYMSCM